MNMQLFKQEVSKKTRSCVSMLQASLKAGKYAISMQICKLYSSVQAVVSQKETLLVEFLYFQMAVC